MSGNNSISGMASKTAALAWIESKPVDLDVVESGPNWTINTFEWNPN